MRFLRLFLILLTSTFYLHGQDHSFAWFTDTHVGSPSGETDLYACIKSVNNNPDIKFVVVTGDIAEKGRNIELEKAKELLGQLKVQYYIFPGNHDTKWSESFCTKFIELWGDDKFAFEFNNIKHVGVNSGIIWRGGGGHVASEDIIWLDSVISSTPKSTPVFLYTHHPLDGDIDNWFKVINAARKGNVQVLLYGHGHNNRADTINGIPAFESRSTLAGKGISGYTLCTVAGDSLFFSEVVSDTIRQAWGATNFQFPLAVPPVDSLQFINYSASISWTKDLKTTVSAAPLVHENKLIVAAADGKVYCYDQQGKELWKFNTGGNICSRPVAHLDILAVATHQGDLFTLRIGTGKVIQSIGLDFKVTGQLALTPTFYQDEKTMGLLIGSATGKIYCYDLFLMNEIWVNASAQQMIETQPLAVDGRIVYGSWDNYLYCVDAKTGTLNWKWTENKNFYYSPAACFPVSDGKYVYVSTPDKFISKIDLLLGTTVWRHNAPPKPEGKKVKKKDAKKSEYANWETIGISGDKLTLIVKAMNGRLLYLDAATGEIKKEFDLGFGLDTTPVTLEEHNGTVVFGVKKGIVYMANGDTAEPLFFMGTSRVLSSAYFGNQQYALCNMDGSIVVVNTK
ncbi:MAG: PQQ-binding-like beta-propeller repeat protein [Ignavibacteriales bacterium]|nr:PQQ-binding-like beta-propeller repeat protein [Ignavibacteriales bacterium]